MPKLLQNFGQNFDANAENYVSDQKMAHYARVPPRAVFRGQVLAVVLNCLIFVAMLDWMVTGFDDGTLCRWSNAYHFVCSSAVLVFSSAVEYGAFGVKNMFALYPVLPCCFLIGAAVGIAWGLGRRHGPALRAAAAARSPSSRACRCIARYLLDPLASLSWFDPAVAWAGALTWTGGSNLSIATNGLYLSFLFMYYVKRRYGAWWEKYNYLIEAGFGVGTAVSGILQTYGLAFTGVQLRWWGNEVATAGVDFRAYNQNTSLLPIPDVGYFGPDPDQYPMKFS